MSTAVLDRAVGWERSVLTLATFGQWVKEARTRAGLTQEGLAEAVGVSRQQIIRIEKGEQGTRPPIVRAIAARTGANLADGLALLASRDAATGEITYEPDPDYIPVPEGYRDDFQQLDEEGRVDVANAMEAAILTALNRQRKRHSIGQNFGTTGRSTSQRRQQNGRGQRDQQQRGENDLPGPTANEEV